jgi:23S rRNA (guanosine2251-2'-O)-methyltransferase
VIPRARGSPRGAGRGGGYWLSGRQAVLAAVRAGRARRLVLAEGAARSLGTLLAAAAAAGVSPELLPRRQVDGLAGTDAQGCAAWVRRLPAAGLEEVLAAVAGRSPCLLVACDHLQDPHNLGAVARSAEAVGAQALLLPDRRAAPVSAAAERVSAGALQALPHACVHNLAWALRRCREAGLWIYGLDPDGEADFRQVAFAPRAVLAVGNEGAGLGRTVRAACDVLVRLPMRGTVESLNAAVAAGVLLYGWLRAVEAAPGGGRTPRRPEAAGPHLPSGGAARG